MSRIISNYRKNQRGSCKGPWSRLTRRVRHPTFNVSALTFLDTGALKSNGIPRGPCSRKGEIGWIAREDERGRGWSDLDARAGGNQRLALCNHFCLSLVLSPSYRCYTGLPPPGSSSSSSSSRPYETHTCARAGREGKEGWCRLNVHAHHLGSSKCILIPDAGDGITLCRCVYEHARATAREARVSWREGIDPCTPHAFARPPLLLLTRHTSA